MTDKKDLYRVKFLHEEFSYYVFSIYCFIVGKSTILPDLYYLSDFFLDNNKPFIEVVHYNNLSVDVIPSTVLERVYKDFKNVISTYIHSEFLLRIDKMNSVVNIKDKNIDNVVHLKSIKRDK